MIRGKKLESVLNRLFETFGILVREAFTLTGDDSEGIVEQIDGVIEFEHELYFVEMKWWGKPIGKAQVSEHLVRVYHRAEARAIIISASEFTSPAVNVCKEALQQKVVVLMTLQEIVMILEREEDLSDCLKKKIQAAVIDRKPYNKYL